MFTKAIVRKPAHTYANGITSSNLGKPDFELVKKQHDAYCEALVKCGLELIVLDPDPNFPDSCFVEDTAVVTKNFGIITRPGDPRRLGEEIEIKKVLEPLFKLYQIEEPGTLDGGDVMLADNHFYIGLTNRTNLIGSKQFQQIVTTNGYKFTAVPICKILHFKTGINYLGDNNILIQKPFIELPDFETYHKIPVEIEEQYAANSLRVNDYVITPKGFNTTKSQIEKLGYKVIELEMSEFQKMDGGLSCLSLRF